MNIQPSESFVSGSHALTAHLPLMRAIVRRFFAQSADQDDAIQDAAVAVISGACRFHGRSTFRTWVYRVTCNACLMQLRSVRRRTRREATTDYLPDLSPGNEEFSDSLIREETIRQLQTAIAVLPDAHREIIHLRYFDELDVAQCAARLGLPEAVVKTRSLRARRNLRKQIVTQTGAE